MFIQENAFEKVVSKMAAILSRPQRADTDIWNSDRKYHYLNNGALASWQSQANRDGNCFYTYWIV